MALFHIHIPFVHGFIVGPTSNPFYVFSKTLFIKYDFPVRYFPQTQITASGYSIDLRNYYAYGLIENPELNYYFYSLK